MDLPNPYAYGILAQREMKCMMKFQNLSDLLDALDSPDALPKLPEPIRKELERIQKLEGEPYGLVFAVRDLYETVLKVICLAICVLIDRNGEDDFCRVLLSPKPMSMGDWLNDLPAVLKKSRFVDGHPEIRSYLKKLISFNINLYFIYLILIFFFSKF